MKLCGHGGLGWAREQLWLSRRNHTKWLILLSWRDFNGFKQILYISHNSDQLNIRPINFLHVVVCCVRRWTENRTGTQFKQHEWSEVKNSHKFNLLKNREKRKRERVRAVEKLHIFFPMLTIKEKCSVREPPRQRRGQNMNWWLKKLWRFHSTVCGQT